MFFIVKTIANAIFNLDTSDWQQAGTITDHAFHALEPKDTSCYYCGASKKKHKK